MRINIKMFVIVSLLFIIAGLAPQSILIFAQEISTPSIIITEIGVFESADAEWIEIYNKNGAPINLEGWKFFEDKTNHGISVSRGESTIAADTYAVIASKADVFIQTHTDYSGTVFDSSWGSLKEEGEEIGLKNPEGNFSELFTYPSVAKNGSAVSIERIDINTSASEITNWVSHPSAHSIGKPNENALPTTQPETPQPATTASPQSTEIPTATQPATAPVAPQPTAPPPAPSPIYIPVPASPKNSYPKAIIQIQSGSTVAANSTTVNFDGRASFDPDGDTLTFLWDMGDGTSETTANPPPHKYGKPGTYTITLTVTDTAGLQNQIQQYVQVINKIAAAVPNSTTAPTSIIQLPKNLTSSGLTFEINGFLVLQPAGNNKPATKTTATKTTKKKSKPASKKARTQETATKNGDLSDEIKITEVFPNPSSGNEEWIEIFNGGDSAVNLGNWELADSSKKSSPYKIPDTIRLGPGQYITFPKSKTKISLNNDKDEIFLNDFEQNMVDRVEYESPQKGNSYALVHVVDSTMAMPGLIASAKATFPKNNYTWEWTDEPSPNKPNPVFKKINGSVSRLLADGGYFEIALQDGSTKKINFDEKTLNPLAAQAVLQEGSQIAIQARENKDGTYKLKKIEEVRPVMQEKNNQPYISWIIMGVVIIGVVLNGILTIKILRKKDD